MTHGAQNLPHLKPLDASPEAKTLDALNPLLRNHHVASLGRPTLGALNPPLPSHHGVSQAAKTLDALNLPPPNLDASLDQPTLDAPSLLPLKDLIATQGLQTPDVLNPHLLQVHVTLVPRTLNALNLSPLAVPTRPPLTFLLSPKKMRSNHKGAAN